MRLFRKAFFYGCFAIYLFFLFYLLFLSSYRSGVKGIIDYNLIPFRTINRYFTHFDGISPWMVTDQFFGNILAFVPFGFFMPLLLTKKPGLLKTGMQALLLSFIVELAQFFFRVGAFDVDDLILNGIGGAAGYGIWAAVSKRKKIR